MDRKGQGSMPFTMIEAVVTFLILIGAIYTVQIDTTDYVKEETTKIQAQRLANAALVARSAPRTYMELEMSNYLYRVKELSSGNWRIIVKYQDTTGKATIEKDSSGYSDITYEETASNQDFTRIKKLLCLHKTVDGRLEISTGDCPEKW
ncbi:MAG: hypothetical protein ABEK01_03610 [Candidatus Nanohaloarchaea archaeon]